MTTSRAIFCRSSSSCCPRDWPGVSKDGTGLTLRSVGGSESIEDVEDTGGGSESVEDIEDTGGGSERVEDVEDTGGGSESVEDVEDTGGGSESVEDTGGTFSCTPNT